MKLKVICFMIILFLICGLAAAAEPGIHSLKIQEILKLYNGPAQKLRELDKDAASLSDNRIRINYLHRHIAVLKMKTQDDISAHLKSIYKDSIIILYEELDKLQSEIIAENINSINEISAYLVKIKNTKQDQDEEIEAVSERVFALRGVLCTLSDTFDSYDQIIEKQNELIDDAIELNIEAYKNTVFLMPGLEAASNLTPYISLGLGHMTHEGRFSYGGVIKAGFSPTEDIINVGVSVMVGVGFGKVEK